MADMSGKGSIWVTDITQERPVSAGTEGHDTKEPTTVIAAFRDRVVKSGLTVAIKQKTGMGPTGPTYRTFTWTQYAAEVDKVAKSLIACGLEAFGVVNIIGFNSPEWFFADIGAIMAGGVATGIYTTSNDDSCQYVTEHSSAKVVFVENREQLDKYKRIRDRCPTLEKIVMWDASDGAVTADDGEGVLSWAQFLQLGTGEGASGREVTSEELAGRTASVKPGHCCTLVYTSGTTANPKAVMISHDNATWTAKVTWELLQNGEDERIVSYLPLSHIAAQMIDLIGPIVGGSVVTFAQPDALRGSLKTTLGEVNPTVFFAVPRVWEKMAMAVREVAAAKPKFVQKISGKFKAGGAKTYTASQTGQTGNTKTGFISGKYFNKIHGVLGMTECRLMLTAAAPISMDTLDYFGSLNIHILELFGMSECTGPHTLSYPGFWKAGTCGPTMPNCGLKSKVIQVDEKGNGELCLYGRNMMMGYLNNDEATAETFDSDGYLLTGDVAKIDEQGFVSITGRIKEIIITAGGENIPPVAIEDKMKELMPYVSNVMVIGDKMKFLSMVVTLKLKQDRNEGFTNELDGPAARLVAGVTTIEQAMASKEYMDKIATGIEQANAAAASRAYGVRKHIVLNSDFSHLGEIAELTATMKLRRRVCAEKYKSEIDGMYAE